MEGYNPELIIKQPGFSRHCWFHSPLTSTDLTTQITLPKHIDPQNFREQFKHPKSTQNGFVQECDIHEVHGFSLFSLLNLQFWNTTPVLENAMLIFKHGLIPINWLVSSQSSLASF